VVQVTVARNSQPRSLIVTIYGAYAREAGGWLSVAALIRLMESLGVDEPAVRSSISRLKRRGILVADRLDGAAGYGLSERAREILAEGDRRIFHRRVVSLEEGWVLAVFSVPETERSRRHTLRSRLTWLGFGNVAPGVWIAPVQLAEETHDVLGRLGLTRYVDLFTARAMNAVNLAGDVARWWNLERISAAYADYAREWRSIALAWQRRRRVDVEQAFVDYMLTLNAWRRLPYLDPGLPAELLPPDWPATDAAEVFFALHDRLQGPAHEFVEIVRSTFAVGEQG
jgi:phenylacetic acid degradation operon negative regulatory protein